VLVLTAEVEVGNEPSRRLLERLGFTLTGTRDNHWQLERPTR
jgi:RimJ/RimL family protein N-acetyltransferase